MDKILAAPFLRILALHNAGIDRLSGIKRPDMVMSDKEKEMKLAQIDEALIRAGLN